MQLLVAMKLDHLYQDRLETNIVPKKTQSTNWWYFRASGKKWLHAFAWSPVLERLCMHPRLWPIILELFDGANKISSFILPSFFFCYVCPEPVLANRRVSPNEGGWISAGKPKLGAASGTMWWEDAV